MAAGLTVLVLPLPCSKPLSSPLPTEGLFLSGLALQHPPQCDSSIPLLSNSHYSIVDPTGLVSAYITFLPIAGFQPLLACQGPKFPVEPFLIFPGGSCSSAPLFPTYYTSVCGTSPLPCCVCVIYVSVTDYTEHHAARPVSTSPSYSLQCLTRSLVHGKVSLACRRPLINLNR